MDTEPIGQSSTFSQPLDTYVQQKILKNIEEDGVPGDGRRGGRPLKFVTLTVCLMILLPSRVHVQRIGDFLEICTKLCSGRQL